MITATYIAIAICLSQPSVVAEQPTAIEQVSPAIVAEVLDLEIAVAVESEDIGSSVAEDFSPAETPVLTLDGYPTGFT